MTETELLWYGKTLPTDLKQVGIIEISDLHYGNPYCAVSKFDRTIEFILNHKNVYAFLNGDLHESSIRTSKGDIFKQVGTPQEQRDWIKDRLAPIRKQLLGATTGNHEGRIFNEVGVDLTKDIAEAMEIPYRPEGLLYKLSFGGGNSRHDDAPYVFWSYRTHGFGGARTKSAKAAKVERMSTWVDADWYAMSHDHVVNVAPDIYLKPDNRGYGDGEFIHGKVTAKRKMLVKTNAYLKWGGYAEQGGFPPSDLTTPLIWLLTPRSPMWESLPDKPKQAVKVVV